ncbi:MAG: hypothetical protein K2M59_06005, partial [Muribaculaceae bacterium]|nr:hypothetical protein [Muribaculaceae bacterium]
LLAPLFKALGRAQLTGLSNRLHAVYMQIPQTHLKQMPEMSPDRYIHTRGVYCSNVFGEFSECPKF